MRFKFYQWWIYDFAQLIGTHSRLVNGDLRWVFTWLYYCLFPLRSFHTWLHRHDGYQPKTNSWLIDGVRFSNMFFATLGRVPTGTQWILTKEHGGSYTLIPYEGES